jgi:hypothetical protein
MWRTAKKRHMGVAGTARQPNKVTMGKAALPVRITVYLLPYVAFGKNIVIMHPILLNIN